MTAFGWRPRRSVLLAVGLVASALISLVALQSPTSAVSGGDPYAVPLVNDTNPNPDIVETTITSNEATVDIGNGISANAQTYNGAIPGPTFKLKVGNTVIVHYNNQLEHESGIHWHGIELANSVDGTPFTQNMVPSGGNFLYKFKVTRPGLFWYHPHHHSSTNQVFKGLYGMIIVEDPNENALQASGTLPSDAQTKPIVLSDTTVCKAPGTNSVHTYDDTTSGPAGTQPWAGGAANTLPQQSDPTPKNLCEGPASAAPSPVRPYPIDEDGVLRGPFAAGDIPNIQTALHSGRTNEGQTVLTNGKNVGARGGGPTADGYVPAANPDPGAALLNVRPGQGLRLQLLNASAVRYMRLQLTRPNGTLIQLRRVGGEGGLLDNAVTEGGTQSGLGPGPGLNTKFTTGEILLPPGTRADVVAAIPASPTTGVLTLWTRDYDRTGMGYTRTATVPVMHLNLSGSAVSPAYTIPDGTPLRAATGDLVENLGSLPTDNLLTPTGGFVPPKQGSNNQTISLTQGATEAGVDNVFGTHEVAGDYKNADHLNSTRYAKQGDVLQLMTFNATGGAHHPFHEHGFSIQPIRLNGPAANDDYVWPYREFRDNIDIPENYTLIFRMRLDARPQPDGTTPGGALGRWVFHCHIFFHATDGMLSELVVTNPTGNERPNINPDNYFVTVRRGHAATVTGTFGDKEGNPVSLSSSAGTIADTGGGNFRWRLARPRGGDRVVYLTATDSNGLKGQIPFQLNKWPEIRRLRVKKNRIRFNLTEAATVRFKLRRIGGGASKRLRKRFNRGGRKKVRVPRRLPPGLYRLTAKATDRTGLQSGKYKAKFRN